MTWRWLWFKRDTWFRGWPLAYPNQVRVIAALENCFWSIWRVLFGRVI